MCGNLMLGISWLCFVVFTRFFHSQKKICCIIQTQPQPLVSAAVYAPTALGILLGHCNLDELDFVSRCMIMVLQWFIMASDGFYGLITRKSYRTHTARNVCRKWRTLKGNAGISCNLFLKARVQISFPLSRIIYVAPCALCRKIWVSFIFMQISTITIT